MREKRAAEPGAAMGTWLAPVEMPVQTYQWNKRAVAEAPPEVALPLPPPPVAVPGVADVRTAPPQRVQRARSTDRPGYGGLALACLIALAMPVGIAVAVEGLSWRHDPGVNVVLAAVVATTILVGSILIGLLAGELGRRRSILRGLAAAGLAGITTVLLELVVDAHPGKFGFSPGPVLLVALLGPVFAFAFASGIGTSR